MRTILAAALVAASFSGAALTTTGAFAAEPIVGTWKRSNGTMIRYSGSGSRFCGTVLNGKYKGKSIGCMSGKGKSYRGKVNKLDEGKTYTGKATVSGNSMKLAGCVARILCKSETLRRQ